MKAIPTSSGRLNDTPMSTTEVMVATSGSDVERMDPRTDPTSFTP